MIHTVKKKNCRCARAMVKTLKRTSVKKGRAAMHIHPWAGWRETKGQSLEGRGDEGGKREEFVDDELSRHPFTQEVSDLRIADLFPRPMPPPKR